MVALQWRFCMAFQLVAVFNLSGRFALRETIAFSCDRPGFLWMNSCNYTSAAKKKWVTVFRSQYDAFAYLCNLPYNPNRTRIVAVVGVPPGYLLPTILWMHATLNKEKVNLGGGQTCIHACYGSKSIKMHCDWSVNSMCLGAQMEQAMQN